LASIERTSFSLVEVIAAAGIIFWENLSLWERHIQGDGMLEINSCSKYPGLGDLPICRFQKKQRNESMGWFS
jgi:hypothetical protein